MHDRTIPVGWQCVPLSSVATVQTGIAKGKAVNGKAVTLPYLRVANVQDGYIDLSVIKEITVSEGDAARHRLRTGDVLFTEGGDFDKLGRGTVWRGGIENCLHQNHIFAVRPEEDHLLAEFLAYQASSGYGRRYFQLSSKQSTNLASINSTQLKGFPVLKPPLAEQGRIVGIMRTWDEAVEKLEATRQLKLKRLDGVAQRLLASTRAIGRNIIPSNWALTTFGEVFSERRDRNSALQSDDVVTVGKYAIRKQSEHFTRSVASKDLSSYWIILPGDFVYDPMSVYYGAIGRYGGTSDGLVSPAYRVIQLNEQVMPDFCVHLLRAHHIRFLLEMRSTQGNREGKRRLLQREEFDGIEFFLPPKEEQARIASILSDFETDLRVAENLIEKTERQRRGLLQKLLTGEWRVKVGSEKEAAA